MDTPLNWLQTIPRKLFPPSIRYKIIAPYAIVTLLLASFGTFLVTTLIATSVEDRFKSQLLNTGTIVSQEILDRERLRLEVGRTIINTIGMSEAAADQDWAAVENIVIPIMANYPTVDHILVTDKTGQEQRRFYRSPYSDDVKVQSLINSGLNLADWWSVSQVLADSTGKTKVVEIVNDELSKEKLIYTVAPLRIPQGVGGTVLVGHYLKDDLRYFKEASFADLILFDRQGQLLGTTMTLDDQEINRLSQLVTPERFKAIITKQEAEILLDTVELNRQEYRLAYAPFVLQGQIYGLVAITLPTNFVNDTNNLSRNSLTAIFSVTVVVVMVIGYVISQHIIRPLSRLVMVTMAITKGDLNQRTGLKGEDEVAVLATNFDLMTSELQRQNLTLEEQAGRLKAILSSMADGVIVQDMAGEVITKNPAADIILDKIYKDRQKNNVVLSHVTPLSLLLPSLVNLESHQKHNLEIGAQILNAVATPIVSSEGKQFGSVVVLRDITREVESEKLKDKFISSTSHELKTPLTAMKGYNSVLKLLLQQATKQIDKRLYDRILDNFNRTEEQIRDLDNIVQSMLDVSQIEALAFDIEHHTVNLVDIIQQVTQEWAAQFAQKELTFTIAVPDEALWIEGDYERLSQVFNHLIKNAYDYTLIGQVDLTVSCQSDQVEITLQDTGVGVRPEDLPYLFTRFFRAIHEESTYAIAGAGLGLCISRAIIELHKGQIDIQSTIYEGSTVTVVLPLTSRPEEIP